MNNYRTFELESVLNMEIDDSIKKEFSEKYQKECYFKFGDNTKIARLIGMETDFAYRNLYWILGDIKHNMYYIPVTNSITPLEDESRR